MKIQLLKEYIKRTKLNEKLELQRISKGLLENMRKVENENMEERRKKVSLIKEQEKIVPYKVRYIMERRRKKIKDMVSEKVEQKELTIGEQKRKLDHLLKIESELKSELKQFKNEELFLSTSKIVSSSPRLGTNQCKQPMNMMLCLD